MFTDGKHILLLKRKGNSYNEFWSIPGGHAKIDEKPLEAAKRESLEECGSDSGSEFSHFISYYGKLAFHTFFFKIKEPFDVTLSDEHSDYKWIQIEDVEDYKLHPKFRKNWYKFKKVIKKEFKFNVPFSEWLKIKDSSYIKYPFWKG